MTQNNIIPSIIYKNQIDLAKRKSYLSLETLKEQVKSLPVPRDFYTAMEQGFKKTGVSLIAEIKLSSPTSRNLGEEKDVLGRGEEYSEAGADAISIITEKHYFNGDSAFIKTVKEKVNLPILQKDFVIDPYQIYESRASLADAVLLIAKILKRDELIYFVDIARSIGLEPVVEINDELDLKHALETKTRIIAVNARDLDTFIVDIEEAAKMLEKVPDKFLKLGFSGIKFKNDARSYLKAGAKGILVGTSLMKSKDINKFIKDLKNVH